MSDEPDVTIETRDPQPTLTVRFRAAAPELGAKLGEVLPAVYAHAQRTQASIAGAPFSRHHGADGGVLDVEAGMPVAQPAEGEGEIAASELPGGRAAVMWHVGPYEGLGSSHEALQRWVREQGYTPAGGPWEEYVTDPGAEPDSSKWQTRLVLPLAG